MLKTYCQHCGTKHEYTSSKPNFCTNCGQPLSGAKIDTPTKPQEHLRKNSRAMEMSIDDEDGTDVFEVPHINGLEYEIEVDTRSKFTLGSVLPAPEESANKSAPKKRGRPKKK
jgi:hypothetical protein